jgi:ABC-2 type transport system permease protein
MQAFGKMVWVDLKLFSRNWVAAFFTLAFPVLNMFLFGAIYGNQPASNFGGHGSVDVMIPGYIAAVVIGTTGFMNLPLELAARRQLGVLRRLRASPLHPWVILASQVAVNLLASLVGGALLVLVGVTVYHAALPANPAPILLGFLYSALSLYALSFTIAGLVRSVSTARALCMSIFFPMMFLSGGTLPLQFMPAAIQRIAGFLPLTYVVDLLKDLYLKGSWNLNALLVLGGMLVICVLLSVRLFRWE